MRKIYPLARAGVVAALSLFVGAIAVPAFAQSRPLTIRKHDSTSVAAEARAAYVGAPVPAWRGSPPSWALASMNAPKAYSYDSRFEGPLDRSVAPFPAYRPLIAFP